MSQSSHKPPFSVFLAATVVIFGMTLSAADSVGFVPYYIEGSEPRAAKVALADLPELGEEEVAPAPAVEASPEKGVEPTHITIDSIGLDLPISNPDTRDLEELDTVLKNGPA